MGVAAEKLTGMIEAGDRFAHSAVELRATQIEAMNDSFQDRVGRIKLLARRAEEAGTKAIGGLEDMVPLLFPHTAYKSYPESFLAEKKWDRLAKWLQTVSPRPITPVETADIVDIDDWIARLGKVGHFISCSSGTTGKSAMLIASGKDMNWSQRENIAAFSWGSGVAPAQDRRIFGLAPVAAVPRNLAIRDALYAAFSLPGVDAFRYPVPPITIGSITSMIRLRKAIADGTAKPEEIAKFEATSAERQAAVDSAVNVSAEALVVARKDKLYVSGMWAALYKIAEAVRAMGYEGKDFHPDNTCYVGGGLKGAQLPPNYRQYVFDTFNIRAERVYQMYGMQEIGTSMPRCQKGGRYHVPPWLVPIVLDRDGDHLIAEHKGQVEGRAAFFDLALDGRWGGVISGDKVTIDFDPCPCGRASPTVLDTIARFKELEGDDKISCAGTVDAYVRGLS